MTSLARPSGCKVQGAPLLSEEVLDELLLKTESTLQQMERSRSSPVHFPRAELEILKLFGLLRDFMMSLLQSERGDRVALRGIFGGDCERICRIRTICEVVRLSDAASGDQRMASCLNSCKIVETVLQDLGLGFALQRAKEARKRQWADTQRSPQDTGHVAISRAESLAANSCDVRLNSSVVQSEQDELGYSETSSPRGADEYDAHTCAFEEALELSGLEQSVLMAENMSESEPSPEQELSPEMNVSETLKFPLEEDKLSDSILDEEFTRLVKATKTLLNDVVVEDCSEAMSEPLPEPETCDLREEIVPYTVCMGHALSAPHTSMSSSPAEKLRTYLSDDEDSPVQKDLSPVRPPSCPSVVIQDLDATINVIEPVARPRASYKDVYSLLSHSHQSLIRELFVHYVGPGGFSAGTGLGLSKFRYCLRDCGLLSEDAYSEALLLNSSQADLMLARAAGATCSRSGMAQKLRTVESFARALADVAVHVSPELAPMPDQALDVFCEAVLVPLAARVLRGVDQYVRSAATALAEHDVAMTLRRCQKGLAAIFTRYASAVGALEPYRRGHWTVRTASRFAVDARLAADLSLAQVQQLFVACASREACTGRGEEEKLSYDSFLLALVAISFCIYDNSRWSATERLARLLYKISDSLPGHHDIATAARMRAARRGSCN